MNNITLADKMMFSHIGNRGEKLQYLQFSTIDSSAEERR